MTSLKRLFWYYDLVIICCVAMLLIKISGVHVLMLGLMLCSRIHCEGECNYLYDTVPASSNDTTCTVSEGNTVYFPCVVYDTCNSISVVWYKSGNARGYSEQITESVEPDGKYQIVGTHIAVNSSNLAGYCSTVSFLAINNFNHTNDSGHYWCWILASGTSLLLPSPQGYVSLKSEGDRPCGNGDFNHYLSPRLCAEYPISTEPVTSTRMTMLTSESTETQHDIKYDESESIANISRTTLYSSTTMTDGLTINHKDLFYGTTIGILLSTIVPILMILLCLVMVLYRKQKKREHGVKAHNLNTVNLEISPVKETVPNPHYRKIIHLHTDNSPQHESSESKQISTARTNNQSEQYKGEGEYVIPAIDTTQEETKGSETHEESIQLNQNVAYSQSRLMSKKQDLSVADRKSSPPSHYEVIRGQSDHKELADTTRSPSPEYAEIVRKDEHQQKKEIEEEHYYHRPDVHYYSSIAELVCTDEPNSCNSTYSSNSSSSQ